MAKQHSYLATTWQNFSGRLHFRASVAHDVSYTDRINHKSASSDYKLSTSECTRNTTLTFEPGALKKNVHSTRKPTERPSQRLLKWSFKQFSFFCVACNVNVIYVMITQEQSDRRAVFILLWQKGMMCCSGSKKSSQEHINQRTNQHIAKHIMKASHRCLHNLKYVLRKAIKFGQSGATYSEFRFSYLRSPL